MNDTRSELEQLYNQSIKLVKEGQVITGRIVAIKQKEVLVDVGFKSEGSWPSQNSASLTWKWEKSWSFCGVN